MSTKKRPTRRARWTKELVYHHARSLPIETCGALKTASKARLIGALTGAEPTGIGAPGDGLLGGEAIAQFLNEFYGISG
jgi:hypothetical protein